MTSMAEALPDEDLLNEKNKLLITATRCGFEGELWIRVGTRETSIQVNML